jgi:hypothetical protein
MREHLKDMESSVLDIVQKLTTILPARTGELTKPPARQSIPVYEVT